MHWLTLSPYSSPPCNCLSLSVTSSQQQQQQQLCKWKTFGYISLRFLSLKWRLVMRFGGSRWRWWRRRRRRQGLPPPLLSIKQLRVALTLPFCQKIEMNPNCNWEWTANGEMETGNRSSVERERESEPFCISLHSWMYSLCVFQLKITATHTHTPQNNYRMGPTQHSSRV